MKNFKLLSLFLILFFFEPAFSQWSNYYTGGQHWDCSFINPNTGWAGGDGLKIFRTTNGGSSWELIHSPSSSNIIYSLCFKDFNVGWAGTYSGEIYKTTNGGFNWTATLVAYNKKINSLYFINQNTGWLAGESGVYAKTTNGGIQWSGSLPGSSDSFDIYFLDSLKGFVCGYEKLATTTDGGSNWNIISYTNVILSSISFINSQTGYVLGSLQNVSNYSAGLYVLKTTNGGINWNNIFNETAWPNSILQLKDSHFQNENIGIYVGTMIYAGPSYSYSGVMRKTTDGGMNWSNINNYWGEGLHCIEFANSLTGFAAGTGAIYKTTNGGVMFIQNKENIYPQNYSLYQNYPNPFNPVTKIKFDIAGQTVGQTFLSVYDITGREIQTLVNEKLNPGTYEVTFDGSNLASGIYFYQLSKGNYVNTKKLVLLK